MQLSKRVDPKIVDAAWHFVCTRLFFPATDLIYDHVTDDPSYFPTREEAMASFPNPCGYGTGMEDSMINAGSMLLACVNRYRRERCEEALQMAHRLVNGVYKCWSSARSHGFLPRSVTPSDGVSHYVDSSRDQYTLCVYGLHVYLKSGMATPFERERICRILVSFAERAEQNVTPENNYDMLREDGLPTVCTVMWGETLGNHEFLRLPMIYLAAWSVSCDARWMERYLEICDEAIARSLPMAGRYWHLYTLQQMQMSARLCYDLDPDEKRRMRYRNVMHAVADYAIGQVEAVRGKLMARDDYNAPFLSFHQTALAPRPRAVAGGCPNFSPVREEADSFFILQDAFDLQNVIALCPDRVQTEASVELFCEAVKRIDFERHVTSAPVQLLEAYYGG